MLALTGKLMVKDRLTRGGPAGFAAAASIWASASSAARWASIGIGNIGAEMFRLLKPFDMKFIAHDPYADKALAAELGVELVDLEDAVPPRRRRQRQLPADRRRPVISSMPSGWP